MVKNIFSTTKEVDLPRLKDFWQEIDGILLQSGMCRKTFMDLEESALKGFGEAGIGHFSLRRIVDDTYEIEARNHEAIEILENLLVQGTSSLKEKQEKEGIIPKKKAVICSKCNVECREGGDFLLSDGGYAHAEYCPLCKKIEWYYRGQDEK